MVVASPSGQFLTRLTPIADALAAINLVKPVGVSEITLAKAAGHILATDVVASAAQPKRASALYEGIAVSAETTLDASSYSPVQVRALRVATSTPMPEGADAVVPLDAVQWRGDISEVTAPIGPGDGVLQAGGDCAAGAVLHRAGQRLHLSDAAMLSLTGVDRVNVRSPKISVASAGESDVLQAAAAIITQELRNQTIPVVRVSLEAALRDDVCDAVIGIGGTGNGMNDTHVLTLAQVGRVAFHGIGLSPGETAAFGFKGTKPVLLLPERLDAALATWCVLGRKLLARLSGSAETDLTVPAKLTRKIASTVGIAEFVPVSVSANNAEPLATKHLPLSTLVGANGWVLVPPESEGYQIGASVMVHPWL
jgi:molybdopterin molybdotransferase